MPNMRTPKPETMAEQWAEFEARILAPLHLSEVDTQYRETRRAFYQGGLAMLTMVKEISEAYSEEEACDKLDAIRLEFRRFEQDLANGRA